MELRHLRYFVALAECLHFTRAAEQVHVTQSTLSHQIRQLEEEIGKDLFDRIGKKVMLTEAGTLFLEHANSALAAVNRGISALKEPTEELSGEVRVGATHTFNLNFIPECISTFLRRYPTAKVFVEELSADAISGKVADGELDLGIAYRPSTPQELWFEPFYSEEMVLVVGDEHPMAERKRIRLVELHRQPLVMLPEEFATRIMLNDCFRACGAEPKIVAEMNTISPMLALVEHTQIGAVVAHNAVVSESGLNIVLLESPTPVRTPGILWKRDTQHQSPEMRAFSRILRKLALSRSLRISRYQKMALGS